MSIIICPYCRRQHVVNKYDTDYICDNSSSQKKSIQNEVSSDLMTKNNWNLNEWSTREDSYRDVYIDKLVKLPSDKNRYAGGVNSHNW